MTVAEQIEDIARRLDALLPEAAAVLRAAKADPADRLAYTLAQNVIEETTIKGGDRDAILTAYDEIHNLRVYGRAW